MATRITMIEKEAAVRAALLKLFPRPEFELNAFATPEEAWGRPGLEPCDLLIVDLHGLDMNGTALIRSMRERDPRVAMIVTSARDAVEDRVAGLEAGADDYLGKPYEFRELYARVRALMRRNDADKTTEVRVGPLHLTVGNPSVRIGGEPVLLSKREFGLLELLALRADQVVHKTTIARRLSRFGDELSDAAIEVAIHRLRRRLAPARMLISTARGFGYRLEAQTLEQRERPSIGASSFRQQEFAVQAP